MSLLVVFEHYIRFVLFPFVVHSMHSDSDTTWLNCDENLIWVVGKLNALIWVVSLHSSSSFRFPAAQFQLGCSNVMLCSSQVSTWSFTAILRYHFFCGMWEVFIVPVRLLEYICVVLLSILDQNVAWYDTYNIINLFVGLVLDWKHCSLIYL